MNPYCIRIINLDFYVTTPIQGLDVMYSEFRGSSVYQVPILRLFGCTDIGKKICLHIHGVFPYLYIPYDGTEEVNSLMYQIAINLDKAINISLNQTSSSTQHVYKIVLVSGIPMYGYHTKEHQFLKIYLYNPLLIKRVSSLLMNDATLGKIYQPHETHLPFALQFMIDYNLHGMSNIVLSEMKFRVDPDKMDLDINPEFLLPVAIRKMSVCELEADVFPEHIQNQLKVSSGSIGVNPGIAALWADEMQRRRNKGEASLIEHPLELGMFNLEPTKSHIIFKQALLDRLSLISTEKEVNTEKLNMSVYAAETPENSSIQSASSIDSQVPLSLELSLNDITLISPDINDTTTTELSNDLNKTLDKQGQDFLKILQNLETNANEDIEEDSILSQYNKEKEEEEKEFDLSLPFESVTTPKKIIQSVDDNSDVDDPWNTTLIPQFDGGSDEKNENLSTVKKEQIFCKYNNVLLNNQNIMGINAAKVPKNMPNLLDDLNDSAENVSTVTSDNSYNEFNTEFEMVSTSVNNATFKNIFEEPKSTAVNKISLQRKMCFRNQTCGNKKDTMELKSWQNEFKRAKKKELLVRTMKNILKKELKICTLLQEDQKPVFKVIYLQKNKLNLGGCSNKSAEHVDRQESTQNKDFVPDNDSCKSILKKDIGQLLFLDGANDSSSSEDELSVVKLNKRTRTETNSSCYLPLPVNISSSTGPRLQREHSYTQPIVQTTIKNFQEEKTPLKKHAKQSVCEVKRKLSFCDASPLCTTIIEENLICAYSPHRKQNKNINNTDNEIESSVKYKKPLNEYEYVFTENANCVNTDPNTFKIEELSKNNILNIRMGSDIRDQRNFVNSSDLVDKHDSFFNSPQIVKRINSMVTAAEKYDKQSNYKAKEGTSKVLTPSSITSQNEAYHSSGSSSIGLLTPHQYYKKKEADYLNTIHEDGECNENPDNNKLCSENVEETLFFSEHKVKSCDNSSCQIFSPVKKAPSKIKVTKSLDKYKIPLVNQQLPFYSNVEDVTGSVEIGYSVLKITDNTTAHLTEFDVETDDMNNFRKLKMEHVSSNLEWKKSYVNNLLLSYCKNKDCTIGPIKKPPTKSMIKKWMKEKSKITATERKVEKKKIFIPLSPANDEINEGDLNISLTISPYTPSTSESNSSQTRVSKSTNDSSPVLKKKSKRVKHNKSTSSLRESVCMSQDSLNRNNSLQITGISPNNTYGFNNSTENLQAAKVVFEHQHLTLLVIELHIRTRGDFKPNPEYDQICAIFYSILNDIPSKHSKSTRSKGVIVINSLPLTSEIEKVPLLNGLGIDCNICYVDSEENLLKEFLKLVDYWNPDVFAGYEIQMLSWGYIIERGNILGMNLRCLLSRIKESKMYQHEDAQDLQLTGRILLDVWRLMRHEIALQSYTFESIVYHILHKRVPQYHFRDLSFWWDHKSSLYRHRTVQYYLFRVETILELFDKLDIIGRTSELARLFGIQFFEVMSRGSQFRVESMMLRLAKPLNFVPVTPSIQQRSNMKAPEYLPLILEPESKLYNDPVIVLDFQSLYPSMIIAYNYCFTTCVGRVECLGKNVPFEFGATQLKISERLLRRLLKKDLLNFSPCGVVFAKKKVRDGILPRMLREILDTRLMVKNSMKENKDDKILQKVLHNRQLGLKLIANVTYGYTAANFSGRMPCVEVADSVVSKGRETLQRAIEMVDNTPEWGAKVVYGDTDSLFVMVPGKSRQQAFEVGKKIADAVTKANPDPVKLKLEKVYQPCILQTKKRYVGYMYETSDQKEPIYDAKGIETVRRDGCPAVSKMLEKCLRLLFETKDVSLIKKYVCRQFTKICAGRVSLQDLTFAKEYRGKSNYRPGACVPALEIAKKWTALDKRSEPRNGERVPYIIVNGPPGLPLIRLVRSPTDLLSDASLRPNAFYYITKVIIPPINRCFNLIGADLNTWFNQMPRKQIQALPSSVSPGKKITISQYFSTASCIVCGEQTQTGICSFCMNKSEITSIILTEKIRNWERTNCNCNLICQSCTLTENNIKCMSLDCPVLYRRIQSDRDLQQASYLRELILSNDFLF